MDTIYLDYAATTPIDPAVLNRMYDLEKNYYGNPSSVHRFGQKSRHIIEEARQTIAAAVGAHPNEIVFTSGGTESDNMAIIGGAAALRGKGRHIITTRIEHPAVLESCRYLERAGYEVTFLDVDRDGMISTEQLQHSITDETILISIMMANNETGVIFPLDKIIGAIGKRNIVLHCDAVQAFGKMNIDLAEKGVDLLSLSAHKIYGPKGIGALYIRRGSVVEKYLHGGSQEGGRRAGTENVAAIGGFAEAVEQLTIQRSEWKRIRNLRDRLESELKDALPGVYINGGAAPRLIGHSNLYFPEIPADSLLMNLDLKGIAISTGSACSSGAARPSQVLTAMGFTPEHVAGSVRISLGRFTRETEIEQTIRTIREIAGRFNRRVKNAS